MKGLYNPSYGLEGVETVWEFRDAVEVMIGDYICEHHEEPTQLMIPDGDWWLLETFVNDMFPQLSERCRKYILKNGFTGHGVKYRGMKIFGTIRVAHVK